MSSTTISARRATSSTCYAPQFFTERHSTPWGAAIDFEGPGAARCAISSSTTRSTGSRNTTSTACGSMRCTRSSTPASRTSSPRSRARRAPGPGGSGRCIWCSRTSPTRRAGSARRPPARLRCAVERRLPSLPARPAHRRVGQLLPRTTEERPHALLCRSLAEGFAYQGERSRHLGAPRGERSAPPAALGVRQLPAESRPGGEPRPRRAAGAARRPRGAARGGGACCCSPRPRRCSSWARSGPRPSPFRTSATSSPELAAKVREGRLREFAHFQGPCPIPATRRLSPRPIWTGAG